MLYYYHPESDSLWQQEAELLEHDGLVEQISYNEYCELKLKQQQARGKNMAGMNYVFDATQFNPEQGIGKHPTGKFPASISETSIEENKNKDGGYFSVTFTTPAGSIRKNYNLWYSNPTDGQKQAVEIANKSLSALCYATGVFKVGMTDEGAALRGARCQIEVTPQKNNPEYHEVSKVYDANGNEPGKAPAAAPQPAAGAQQGGWSSQPAPAAQPAPAPAPAPQQQPANAGWQQGPTAAPGSAPPWAGNR